MSQHYPYQNTKTNWFIKMNERNKRKRSESFYDKPLKQLTGSYNINDQSTMNKHEITKINEINTTVEDHEIIEVTQNKTSANVQSSDNRDKTTNKQILNVIKRVDTSEIRLNASEQEDKKVLTNKVIKLVVDVASQTEPVLILDEKTKLRDIFKDQFYF